MFVINFFSRTFILLKLFKHKVLITTVPFANIDKTPIRLLKKAGIEYLINPLNRKLTVRYCSEGEFVIVINVLHKDNFWSR